MKWTSILFLFFLNASLAQTSLTGYITIQNSKGQSAYPAQVKSFGATDVVTNQADGKFTLVYDKKKPGASATLKVERTGYEVVNRRDLRVTLPKDNKVQRPVKLILCPKGQWQKFADEYYKTNIQQINANYEKQLQQIKQQYESITFENDAYREALFDLDEKKQAALSQAEQMAERFAKLNLDDATDRTATAHRLFTAGKLDSVLMVLDKKEILADFKKAEEKILNGNELLEIGKNKLVSGLEAKEKIIEEFMIKARAHIIKLQWEDARRSYEIATTADDSHFENLLEYGGFLSDQNKFTEAKKIFEKILAKSNDPDTKKPAAQFLGLIHMVQNNYDEAEFYLKQGLSYANSLGDIYPKEIVQYQALSNMWLGMLYRRSNEITLSERHHLKAIEAMKKYGNPKDDEDQYILAKIQFHLSNTYFSLGNYETQGKILTDIIPTWEGMAAQKNDSAFNEFLAKVYNSYSVYLLNHLKDFDGGYQMMNKALQTYENLVARNPNKYMAAYAKISSNLSTIEIAIKDYQSAEKNAINAVEMFRILSKNNPEGVNSETAITLATLGRIYLMKEQYEQADTELKKSMSIFESLAKDYPSRFNYELAHVRSLYPRILYAKYLQSKNKELLFEQIEWIDETEKLLANYEDSFRKKETIQQSLLIEKEKLYPDLAVHYFDLGTNYFKKDNFKTAEENYLLATTYLDKVSQEEVDSSTIVKARVFNELGALYHMRGSLDTAKEYFEKSETAFDQCKQQGVIYASSKPYVDFQYHYGLLLYDLEKYTEAQKNLLVASRYLHMQKEGIALKKGIIEIDGRIGNTYSKGNNMKEAKVFWENCITIYFHEPELKTDTSLDLLLSELFLNMGFITIKSESALEESQRNLAEYCFMTSLEMYQRLSKLDAQKHNYNLSLNQILLALHFVKKLDYTESKEDYTSIKMKAKELLKQAKKDLKIYSNDDSKKSYLLNEIKAVNELF